MRVLVLHNRYRYRGGEDRVVAAETAMLRDRGIDVVVHEVDNSGGLVQLARGSAWSGESFQKIERLCRELQPDIAHVHNFWATLSPSIHAACHAARVPTVQTLHNYRLLCVNALFHREGSVCTDCLGKIPWRGVMHRCYHDSAAASALVGHMIATNRRRDTWSGVDAFIVPSEHARSLFAAGGINAARLHVKPNFAEDPGPAPALPSSSRTIVYAGRLSPEKGVRTLLDAWSAQRGELVIIGDGPDAFDAPGVDFRGPCTSAEVAAAMKNARAIVVPSTCFETFGNSVVEAYACGRPVIASDIGALSELVDDGRTGFKFPPRDAKKLAQCLERILNEAELVDAMGVNARAAYEARFTPGRNFERLLEIYECVLRSRSPKKRSVVGVGVSATSYGEVLTLCRRWIENDDPNAHMIAHLNVHSVMTAAFDPALRSVLNAADIATPDGMPLAWALRSLGIRRQPRVYGPDLMLALCEQAAKLGHRIFLYGGRGEVLQILSRNLTARFPGLQIVDACAPPFRPLTIEEDHVIVRRIRDSEADIVFVGIGAPKQEQWMHSHKEKLPGVVMLGVGAAFDFHAGRIKQAPPWMQRAGLEWCFRFMMEPRRLWKRYMLNPLFLIMWLLQLIGFRVIKESAR
jgi:exopolysaccharide biosynthesis WecB/TagA/CpsF family protein